MKKTISYLFLIVSLLLVGCTTTHQKDDSSATPNSIKENAVTFDKPLKIAFVRLDSVLNNYEGYKEMSKKLEAKASANQNLLSAREQSLQREMNAFNEKLQSGGFINELAAQQEYERIQKKSIQAQQQASKIAETFLKEQQHYNDSLNNIILQEVEKYNQEKEYDLILNTIQMSGVLYGKPELDITEEIIVRLNVSYASNTQK